MDKKRLYPLGHGVFASVKTYRHCVKLYLTRYRVNKTGRLVQAARVGLSQKQFFQLWRIKARLCEAYNQQMSVLDQKEECK